MFRRAIILWAALGVAAVGSCASPSASSSAETWLSELGADHPLTGQILDVGAGAALDQKSLRERVLEARYVLVGETHDNPDHHVLQARIIGWLVDAGRLPSVVLEMLPRSDQAAIDSALAASRDPDAFGEAVNWDESGWPPWSMYRPVFARAITAELPLLAANLPREEAMGLAMGKTELDPELVNRHGLAEPLPAALQESLERELFDSHCGHLTEAMTNPMVTVQRARDALMAEVMLEATQEPVVLIAGRGHARRDRGVPFYLERQDAKGVLSIGLVQVRDDGDEAGAYAVDFATESLPFDVVWFTPRGNDIDHCAELEKQMKARG